MPPVSRGLAVLAVAAAASSLMITPAHAADPSVRYAWVDSCPKKDYTVPCGPWTLAMRGAKGIVMKDAVVFPKAANGKVNKEASAPLTVSGNGRFVNYFRKSDGRLVIRDVVSGSVKALPGRAAKLPKGFGMADIDVTFSNDGAHIAIDYLDERAVQPTLMVDLGSRTTSTLPGDEYVQGFSPDGAHALTLRSTDDNTTEFRVYDGRGVKQVGRVVPQIVSNNAPIALAGDGVTVAVILTGPKPTSKARLRTYDLSTDEVADAVTLSYPTAEGAMRIFWENSGKISLWTARSDAEGITTKLIKRTINPETGAAPVADSFRFRSGLWTWWLPGE